MFYESVGDANADAVQRKRRGEARKVPIAIRHHFAECHADFCVLLHAFCNGTLVEELERDRIKGLGGDWAYIPIKEGACPETELVGGANDANSELMPITRSLEQADAPAFDEPKVTDRRAFDKNNLSRRIGARERDGGKRSAIGRGQVREGRRSCVKNVGNDTGHGDRILGLIGAREGEIYRELGDRCQGGRTRERSLEPGDGI